MLKTFTYLTLAMFSVGLLFSFTLQPTDGGPDGWTINKGRKIFMSKCVSCHKLSTEDYIGPGMDGVTKRQSKEQIAMWAIDHKNRINAGDAYAEELYKKYKYYVPTRSGMSDTNAGYIYDFLYSLDNDGM